MREEIIIAKETGDVKVPVVHAKMVIVFAISLNKFTEASISSHAQAYTSEGLEARYRLARRFAAD